jgi:hypothetical protein
MQNKAEPSKAKQSHAGHSKAWQGMARHGKAGEGNAKQSERSEEKQCKASLTEGRGKLQQIKASHAMPCHASQGGIE